MFPRTSIPLRLIWGFALLLLGSLASGCSFTNGDADGNCLLGVTSDSGTGKSINSTHDAAQSFIVAAGSQISTIAIKLKVNSTDHVTRPSGTIKVSIHANNTVTTPVAPTVPGTSEVPVSNIGVIDAQTVSLTQALFYTVTLPTAITVTTQAAYWVYVATTFATDPNVQIVWEQSTSDVAPNGFIWYQGATDTQHDFLAQVNCGT